MEKLIYSRDPMVGVAHNTQTPNSTVSKRASPQHGTGTELPWFLSYADEALPFVVEDIAHVTFTGCRNGEKSLVAIVSRSLSRASQGGGDEGVSWLRSPGWPCSICLGLEHYMIYPPSSCGMIGVL